ncbi:MAG: class I lanthipeptide [Hyphomicrobiales bacterium]
MKKTLTFKKATIAKLNNDDLNNVGAGITTKFCQESVIVCITTTITTNSAYNLECQSAKYTCGACPNTITG